MTGELHPNADRHDENDRRNRTQLDAQDAHRTEQLHDDCSHDDNDHAPDPGVHQKEADDDKDRGEDGHEADGEPEAEIDVLLPEREGDSGRKIWQSFFFKLFADLSNATDCVHGDLRVTEVVQVKRDPRQSDRLRFWDLEVGVTCVVKPVFRSRHQTRLAVAVGHSIVAEPGREVVVESVGVDDAVGVDEPVLVQECFVDRIINMTCLNHQLERKDCVGGRVVVPATLVKVSNGHFVIESGLESDKPVSEERKPELWKSAIVVFDNGRNSNKGIVVVVQDLLVLGILKVALSDGKHVVEAEVVVLSLEEPVHGRIAWHNVGQIEAVGDLGQSPNSGTGQRNTEDYRQDLDRCTGDPVSVIPSCEPGKRPLLTDLAEL